MILDNNRQIRLTILDKIPCGIYNINLNDQNISLKVFDGIDGYDSWYFSETEYDIRKKVQGIATNGDILFDIMYHNCFSKTDNGGCFEVDFKVNLPINEVHQENPRLKYSTWNGDSIEYSINGVKYILHGLNHDFYFSILEKESDVKQEYNIMENMLYKKMEDFQIGMSFEGDNFKIIESKWPYSEIIDEKVIQSINKSEIIDELKKIIEIFEIGKKIVDEYPVKEIIDKLIENIELILIEKEKEKKDSNKLKKLFNFFKYCS